MLTVDLPTPPFTDFTKIICFTLSTIFTHGISEQKQNFKCQFRFNLRFTCNSNSIVFFQSVLFVEMVQIIVSRKLISIHMDWLLYSNDKKKNQIESTRIESDCQNQRGRLSLNFLSVAYDCSCVSHYNLTVIIYSFD